MSAQSPLRAPTPGNSLGRAKAPCHNCADLELECDRQRPRCFVCMRSQVECRGYTLDLSWQSGVAARGNLKNFQYPAAEPPPDKRGVGSSSSSVPSARERGTKRQRGQFKFVPGKPAQRRKVREQTGQSRFQSRGFEKVSGSSSSPTISPLSGVAVPLVETPIYQNSNDAGYEIVDHMPLDLNPASPSSQANFVDDTISTLIDSSSISDYALDDYDNQNRSPDTASFPIGSDVDHWLLKHQMIEPRLQSPILFGSLADKFHGILAQYDQNICVIPLTSDCGLNPFRVRKESSSGSQFLLHAILATSFYQLTRRSNETSSLDLMERHRTTSLHLFSNALGDPSTRSQGVAFLDTALLLLCLDSAQSANGMFDVHLEGVKSIIEMAGGADNLIPKMPKLRAQLAMFIWYDTTIALISRKNPMLPVTYLEAIIRHGRDDGWDYFKLSGCREDYIIMMIKLAKLAMQSEKAEEMEYLVFDSKAVDQVEEVLRECSGVPPEYTGFEDEEALEESQDRYHCDEAWRTALLLYIARVFRWKRTAPIPGSMRYLGRVILDHARSIARTSTIQKQLLLPVFLAASEIQTEDYREFARDYCKWWTSACGFKMFSDVLLYLEDVWKEQDTPEVWWATIIDQQRQQSRQSKLPQILMG